MSHEEGKLKELSKKELDDLCSPISGITSEPHIMRSCPFCGGEAEMVDMSDNRYHIKCKNCMAQMGDTWVHNGKMQIIKLWNQRA